MMTNLKLTLVSALSVLSLSTTLYAAPPALENEPICVPSTTSFLHTMKDTSSAVNLNTEINELPAKHEQSQPNKVLSKEFKVPADLLDNPTFTFPKSPSLLRAVFATTKLSQ